MVTLDFRHCKSAKDVEEVFKHSKELKALKQFIDKVEEKE